RITFDEPADTGGRPITRYEVTASPGGAVNSGARSPIVVSGLTNGVSYTFTVKAITTAGASAASSASNSVTPDAAYASPVITVNIVPALLDVKVPNGRVAQEGPIASAPGAVAPVSYSWQLLSASGGVSLMNTGDARPVIRSTAHNNNNYAVLRCIAVDATGASGSRDCNVTIRHDASVPLV